MNLTKAEAINLIVNFYMLYKGIWIDYKYNNSIIDKFIEAELTCIYEEDERRIIPNEKGTEILYEHFVEISQEFIKFMQRKGLECPYNEVLTWFMTTYNLKSMDVIEDICFLVSNKLYQFGYKANLPHPDRQDDKVIVWKI